MTNATERKLRPAARTHEQGFTLIELSIVLVIIGLIVGGILVGQDMIKAAEIRASISQIEKLNSAVNTFRNKYNGKPGDLLNATNFGFTARTSNGDGLIGGCTAEAAGTETQPLFGCADKFFWNDLSTAGLIPETFSDTSAATAFPASAISTSFSTYFEVPKLASGNYMFVWANAGLNYLYMRGISSIATTGVFTNTLNLTPLVAFQIDTKMDDGAPGTGSVQAQNDLGGAATPPALTTGATACATSTSLYNTGTTYGNSLLCGLQIRANF